MDKSKEEVDTKAEDSTPGITADIKDKGKGEIEIKASLPAADFDAHRADAVKKLGKDIQVDGFRKGKAPEAKVVERIGEQKVLTEMAERAISVSYGKIVNEHELRVIGRPDVQITKMAMGNPLEFTVTTATLPEIELPDYKAIAAKTPEEPVAEVTDEEIEKGIENIIKNFNATQKKEGEEELKELTDENIKNFGPFEDMADFRKKLRGQLELENTRKAKDKRRMKIAESIMDKATLKLPQVLVDAETGKMLAEMRGNIERVGMNFDDYLKQSGKTIEDMTKEMRPEAEKRAKLQLILNEIAGKEKVQPDPEALKQNVDMILKQQKDADPSTSLGASKTSVQIYVATMLTNEAVFEMLEGVNEEEKK